MQNSYEPVGDVPTRSVVFDSVSALAIVVGARPRRHTDRGERLPSQGIEEPVVVDVTSGHHGLLARGFGDRAGAGEVSTSLA